jgi:hypothetical protein
MDHLFARYVETMRLRDMMIMCLALAAQPAAAVGFLGAPKSPSLKSRSCCIWGVGRNPLLVGGLEHVLFSIIYGIILPIDELIFFKIVKTTNQHILVSLTNPLGRVNIHLPVLIFRFFCSLAVVVGASGVEIREVPNYFRDKSDDSRPFCSTPQKKG